MDTVRLPTFPNLKAFSAMSKEVTIETIEQAGLKMDKIAKLPCTTPEEDTVLFFEDIQVVLYYYNILKDFLVNVIANPHFEEITKLKQIRRDRFLADIEVLNYQKNFLDRCRDFISEYPAGFGSVPWIFLDDQQFIFYDYRTFIIRLSIFVMAECILPILYNYSVDNLTRETQLINAKEALSVLFKFFTRHGESFFNKVKHMMEIFIKFFGKEDVFSDFTHSATQETKNSLGMEYNNLLNFPRQSLLAFIPICLTVVPPAQKANEAEKPKLNKGRENYLNVNVSQKIGRLIELSF
jgi:hypothetical protein